MPVASKAFSQAANMRNRNDEGYHRAFQPGDEERAPSSSARDTGSTDGISCGSGSSGVVAYVDHFYSPITESGMQYLRCCFAPGSLRRPNETTTREKGQQSSSGGSDTSSHHRRPAPLLFPCVLYTILEEAEKEGFGDIIAWKPHGRAFRVYQREAFIAEVMPK